MINCFSGDHSNNKDNWRPDNNLLGFLKRERLNLESVIPQWLQDLETGLSILGFFLTYVVYRAVSDVKKSFQQKARLPEIVKDLSKSGSEISKALSSSPIDEMTAKTEIKAAASIIRMTLKLLPSEQKKELNGVLKKISNKVVKATVPANTDALWEAYTDIQFSVKVLNQAIKNLKWE